MKIPKLKRLQPVEIHWVDSVHESGWKHSSTIDLVGDDEYLDHFTIGYYFGQSRRALTVVQSRSKTYESGNNSVDAQMSIPIVAITKIVKL